MPSRVGLRGILFGDSFTPQDYSFGSFLLGKKRLKEQLPFEKLISEKSAKVQSQQNDLENRFQIRKVLVGPCRGWWDGKECGRVYQKNRKSKTWGANCYGVKCKFEQMAKFAANAIKVSATINLFIKASQKHETCLWILTKIWLIAQKDVIGVPISLIYSEKLTKWLWCSRWVGISCASTESLSGSFGGREKSLENLISRSFAHTKSFFQPAKGGISQLLYLLISYRITSLMLPKLLPLAPKLYP